MCNITTTIFDNIQRVSRRDDRYFTDRSSPPHLHSGVCKGENAGATCAGERTRCVPRAARAVVIDRRQYGCAKAPFCSLSAALRKLLHPHLRIHAKSNRPPVHSRPSVRTSVRTSLVSDNRSRTVHRAAAFFRSLGGGRAAEYRFPGVQAGFKGISAGRNTSEPA